MEALQRLAQLGLGQTILSASPSEALEPGQVLLIGDTTHDFEVAQSLGCDCLLVARGHQCEGKLADCGVPVLGSLLELVTG